jgi:outer membrane beta-barrel protein
MKKILSLVLLVLLCSSAAAVCPQPAESEEGERLGLVRRCFSKKYRHEISLSGGLMANELLGTSLAANAGYAFYINELFGLQLDWSYSYQTSPYAGTVRQEAGVDLLHPLATNVFTGALAWHPFHGKFMAFQSAVPHFDLFLEAGLGVTDNRASRGLTYVVGAGVKIFLARWLTLRLRLRDLVGLQQLEGSEALAQNLELTLGVGFWLPW